MKTEKVKYAGVEYEYPVENKQVKVSTEALASAPTGVSVLLYFFAQCRRFFLAKDAFKAVWAVVGQWVDLQNGGLNAIGQDKFKADVEILAAAKAHVDEKNNTAKKPLSKVKTGDLQQSSHDKAKLSETVERPSLPPIAKVIQPALATNGGFNADFASANCTDVILLPLAKLRAHPLNRTIYDPTRNQGLLASIKAHGVKVPITVIRQDSEYLILDGHQRTECAEEAEFKLIPGIIVDIPMERHLEMLLAYNQHRPKTVIERLREFRAYYQLEKEKSNDRSGLRSDLGVTLPAGEQWGRARDIAAEQVHFSGTTAERGLKVLEELEKRQALGETDEVVSVRNALNESVNTGFKLAYKLGWLDSAIKKRATTDPENTLLLSGDEDSLNGGDDGDPEDHDSQQSVTGWIDEVAIGLAVTQLKLPTDEAEEISAVIRRVRPSLYLQWGTTPRKTTAAQLRHLSQVLSSLAAKCESEGAEE